MKVRSSAVAILFTIPLLFSITGCQSVKTVKVLSPPVDWFIVTPENIEDVFKRLEEQKTDVVLFGITDDGYKSLSLNLAQIRQLLLQQQAIITAYKEYYKETEKRISDQQEDYNQKLDGNVKKANSGLLNIFKR
jgi:hypothetical protein